MIRRTPWLLACLVLCINANVAGQTGTASGDDTRRAPQETTAREIGGRLVATSETVVVKGNRDDPARDSSIATKIDTPLIETPRSISIVDRQTLDDIGVVNITQAHDYTTGMTPQDERGPAFARGFPVDFYDLRRDGLRTYSWSVREPVALDRIQYLRGPASVLYGDGSPGALINLVLKKPMPVRRFEFGASGGSSDFGRFSADATGPLNDARTVRYRVIAAGEWLGNGFDNRERRFTFFPSLAIDLGDRSRLSIDTEVYHQRGRNYRHVVPATADAQRGDFSQYPWDLSIASPDDGWHGGNIAPGVRLDLRLGPQSSLHVSGRYTRIDGDLDLQALSGLAADGRTAQRFHYREISTWNEYQADAFATRTLRTRRIEHRLVVGIEAGLSTTDSQIGIGAAPPLDIYAPDYGPRPSAPSLNPTRYEVTRVGFYATDQIRVSTHVTIVPGVRVSRIEIEDKIRSSTPDASDAILSPSVGAVVQPRLWWSLYSNYTQGFEPPAPGQYLEDGGAPDLSENWSIEGGAKADLLRRRLSVSGALFRIRRTNVPEADPRGFYRQIGEGRSHGIETEAVGIIAGGLSARAGYAWTDTEVTRDASGFVGRELPNAPHHKANVWMRYRFGTSAPRAFMVAGGMVYEGARFTARDNAVTAPAYTRFDASGSVELRGPRLTIGIIAENVTNVRYVRSGAGSNFFAGPPRRVAVQMTSAF